MRAKPAWRSARTKPTPLLRKSRSGGPFEGALAIGVFGFARSQPLAMVTSLPGRFDRSARHAAQRVAGRGAEHGQVEVAGEQDERDPHQPVMKDDRASEAEAHVAFSEPE